MSSKELSQLQINSIIEQYSSGMFKEALECVSSLKKEYPDEPMLLNIAGACYAALGDLTDAVKNYELAISINSNYYKAYFNLGNAFEELNQLDAAVLNYKKALDIEPDYAEAHNNLGNVLKRTDQIEDSIKSFEYAVAIKPDYIEAHYSLGLIYQELERFDDAVRCYEKTLDLKPDFAELHNNLGVVLQELGQSDNAIYHLEKSLAIRPEFKEAHNNLGNILKAVSKFDEAVESYRKAINIEPNYLEAQSNLGATYHQLNNWSNAEKHYKKAISIEPNQSEIQYNLGLVLQSVGKFDESILRYQDAIKIKPDYAEAHNNLGISLKEQGQIDKAIKSFENALEINPEYAESYNNIGNACMELGEVNQAIQNYKLALTINENHAEANNNLGLSLISLGERKAAITYFKKAIEINPKYASAFHNLSTVKKFTLKDNNYILQMQLLLSDPNTIDIDRTYLSFAMAKVFEDLDNKEKFFKYLNQGNALRKKELNYSINNDKEKHKLIKKLFTHSKKNSKNKFSIDNSIHSPIFIVGMPRSGTSLVEQILASHNNVYGAGELTFVGEYVLSILEQIKDGGVQEFNNVSFSEMRNYYLDAISKLNFSEKSITDKMPLNFEYIGFLLSAFPEAKIINLNRDARATCWSIYKYFFSDKGNGYAYDMSDLASFYGLYIDIMSFWHDLYPGKIYDLPYEQLTINQEAETKKLLDFCNLEWDKNCMSFYENKRPVQTKSAIQVRQKIYQGSSDSWKKYESLLQPLLIQLPSKN